MTDLRKAAEMALEAWDNWAPTEPIDLENKIEALRQALAQPEQEPVAWGMPRDDGSILDVICPEEHAREPGNYTVPLYTAPPKREWVGLTDEDVRQAYCFVGDKEWSIGGMRDAGFFAELIEAKLKEKNT